MGYRDLQIFNVAKFFNPKHYPFEEANVIDGDCRDWYTIFWWRRQTFTREKTWSLWRSWAMSGARVNTLGMNYTWFLSWMVNKFSILTKLWQKLLIVCEIKVLQTKYYKETPTLSIVYEHLECLDAGVIVWHCNWWLVFCCYHPSLERCTRLIDFNYGLRYM